VQSSHPTLRLGARRKICYGAFLKLYERKKECRRVAGGWKRCWCQMPRERAEEKRYVRGPRVPTPPSAFNPRGPKKLGLLVGGGGSHHETKKYRAQKEGLTAQQTKKSYKVPGEEGRDNKRGGGKKIEVIIGKGIPDLAPVPFSEKKTVGTFPFSEKGRRTFKKGIRGGWLCSRKICALQGKGKGGFEACWTNGSIQKKVTGTSSITKGKENLRTRA